MWSRSVLLWLFGWSFLLSLLKLSSGDHGAICFKPPGNASDPDRDGEHNDGKRLRGLGVDFLHNHPMFSESSRAFWSGWDKHNLPPYDYSPTPNPAKIPPFLPNDPKTTKFNVKLYQLMRARVPFGGYNQGGGGTLMSGWFRVEIQAIDTNIKNLVTGLLLWADFGDDNPIGQFVPESEFPITDTTRFSAVDCKRNDLRDLMNIPCGGAGQNSPIVSNSVIWLKAKEDTEETARIMAVGDDRSLNFYFRWGFHPCFTTFYDGNAFPKDSLNTIIHVVALLKGHPKPVTANVILVPSMNIFFGAPDHIPTNTKETINCGTLELKHDDGNRMSSYLPGWLHQIAYDNSPNVRVRKEPNYVDDLKWGCQAVLFEGRCRHSFWSWLALHISSPGAKPKGRDRAGEQNQAAPGLLPECWFDGMGAIGTGNSWYPFPLATGADKIKLDATPYKVINYMEYLTLLIGLANKDTAGCDNFTCDDTVNIVPYDRENLPIEEPVAEQNETLLNGTVPDGPSYDEDAIIYSDRGLLMTNVFEEFFRLRKAHAIPMVVATMFLIPLSIFMSRYYKETFMSTRSLYLRIWYQIHIHSTAWISVTMVAGLIVALVNKKMLGPSLNPSAIVHKVMAYFSIVFLILLIGGGGFRSIVPQHRWLCVGVHWGLGIALYVFNIIALWSSVFIPGSPISNIDASLSHGDEGYEKDEWLGIPFDTAHVIIIIWIIFDVCIHIKMQLLMIMSDKQMQVAESRLYVPAPIPVIAEDEEWDAEYSKFRSGVLVVYVFVSLACTITLLAIIISTSRTYRSLGPMYCTSDDDGNSLIPDVRRDCKDGY